MKIKTLYTILLFLVLGEMSFAQTQKAWIEAAELALQNKEYYEAMNYYKTALEFDTSDVNITYATAEAARNFSAYSYAAENYKRTLELDSDNDFPLSQFHLAEMYQRMGKYEKAKMTYELYLSENNGDEAYYSQKAAKEIEACDWAISMEDQVYDYYKVENMGGEVNTEYSEFGASKVDDELYYSSLRFDNPEDLDSPDKHLSKLLISDLEAGGSSVIDGAINNSNSLVAHTAFNMNKTRIYYTICDYINAYDIRCDLYYRPIDEDGEFGEANKLPAPINGDEFTSTQPALGYDKETGRELLFFVSDRDGGAGKLDIWYTAIESATDFSDPVNVDDVNTSENEITPFVHKESSTFYFSSDGYLGMGGYDIYRSDCTEEGRFLNVENMGAPVNSSYNDVYYNLNADGDEAFMSSNRVGSQYLEDQVEACCYDIYRVDIEEYDVIFNAITFNKSTEDSLINTTVRIIDAGTNEEIASITNPDDNDHIFTLPSNRDYIVIAEKQGYSSDTISLSTRNLKPNEEIVKKLYLEPQYIQLDLTTFDRESKGDLTGVTIILEDLTDPSNPDVIRLNELGNDFTFELDHCKKYRITAFKDGYESETMIIDTCDPNIEGLISKEMFLGKPNLSLYLPVTLYFDNDYPNPKSRNMYTLDNYTSTYFPYYSKKEEFKDKYSNPLNGDIKYSASQEIEYFFENEVKGEYNKMQVFFDKLLERLRNGDKFEVAIKGFASPKSNNKYNLALGQRRVYSVRNELRDFAGGAFASFLDEGQLILSDVSFGEELAPASVSDSHSNVRKSIYSPEASRERKAQIVSVRKLN